MRSNNPHTPPLITTTTNTNTNTDTDTNTTGKKKEEKPKIDPSTAIQDLKLQIETLEKR